MVYFLNNILDSEKKLNDKCVLVFNITNLKEYSNMQDNDM